MITPTLKAVERVMRLLGYSYHGNWQRKAARHIIENERCIVQFARQSGKSHTLGLCCVTALLSGLTVTIAMPTLTQSQRIIFRNISQLMRRVEGKFAGRLKRTRDTESECIWNNGAQLRALSSNEASQKEGYTSDWVVIDEAHNAQPSLLAMFNPYITQARRRGTAKIILNGIGGHPSSCIEQMKDRGFSALHITPDEIVRDNSTYEPVFIEAKSILSDEEWRQHYECLPVLEGSRYIFPMIQKCIDLPDYGMKSRFYFGIDVGRTSDNTVVSVVESRGDRANLIAEKRMTGNDFLEQAAMVHRFIDTYLYRPEDVAIEVNGLGVGLYDILQNRMYGIKPVNMNYQIKQSSIFELQRMIRERKLGISDERAYKELSELTYEVRENYKYIYAHSDSLSGLIIARCASQQAVMV